jgi:cyclase
VIEAVAAEGVHSADGGRRRAQVEDVRRLLNAGADKVSINTAAVQNPALVRELPASSATSASWWPSTQEKIAGKGGGWEVYTHGGRNATGLDVVDWAQRMVQAAPARFS